MQNKKKVYLIISIVSFSIVLAALAAIGGLLLAYKRQSDNYEQLAAAARTAAPAAPTTPATEAIEETQPVETEPPLPTVEIPINFDYLKGENEDIIGWIVVDGTLIDSNGVWKDVDREFLVRRGLPYTRAYYEGVAHTIFPLAAKFTKEFCNLPDSEEDIMAEWMELAKDAYAHVTVKPGVRAYLKQCRAEGRRMAVVTSSVPG